MVEYISGNLTVLSYIGFRIIGGSVSEIVLDADVCPRQNVTASMLLVSKDIMEQSR